MRWLKFINLLYQIYGPKDPDLSFIKSSGLLAVKIGQAHALRIDFLNEQKCQQLAKLYRNAASLSPQNAKKLLISYEGKDYLNQFKRFDAKPLAAASVGQVHRAQLLDGQEVVIKIIKQNFAAEFKRDVKSARQLFTWATWFYPRLRGVANPVAILNNIEQMTLRELDLLHEASGQHELKSIYEQYKGGFDIKRLSFAKLYPELSDSHVLVSEFLAGPTLDELIEGGKLSYQTLLDLFKIHGFFMFCVGTFHGDIHPGNIILKDGQFYFLDTAYIGHANDQIRKGLFHFFDALSQYDYSHSAYWLNQMARKPIGGQEYQRFLVKFKDLYSDFTDKSVGEISLTKKMYQTIKLGVLSGMDFDEAIFDIIKSLMYMDGMVLRVDPKAVLLKDMRVYINEFKPFI